MSPAARLGNEFFACRRCSSRREAADRLPIQYLVRQVSKQTSGCVFSCRESTEQMARRSCEGTYVKIGCATPVRMEGLPHETFPVAQRCGCAESCASELTQSPPRRHPFFEILHQLGENAACGVAQIWGLRVLCTGSGNRTGFRLYLEGHCPIRSKTRSSCHSLLILCLCFVHSLLRSQFERYLLS